MPRVKCHFCDTRVIANPANLKREGYYPKCVSCKETTPECVWRCTGTIKSNTVKKNGEALNSKCNRGRNWVKGIGESYCPIHGKELEQ